MFKTVKEQLYTDPKQIFRNKFAARECVISSFMKTRKNWEDSQTAVAIRTVGSCFHSFSRLRDVETSSSVF